MPLAVKNQQFTHRWWPKTEYQKTPNFNLWSISKHIYLENDYFSYKDNLTHDPIWINSLLRICTINLVTRSIIFFAINFPWVVVLSFLMTSFQTKNASFNKVVGVRKNGGSNQEQTSSKVHPQDVQ